MTDLLEDKSKRIADWLRLNATKAFLDELEAKYGSPQIIILQRTTNEIRGTWGSPEVVSRFQQWLKGRKIKSYRFESYHRDQLSNLFTDSQLEVDTPVGKCDVVTKDYVVEVKEARGWKAAIGQAQAYAFYLKKKPAIYLFGGSISKECYKVCKYLGIQVFNTNSF